MEEVAIAATSSILQWSQISPAAVLTGSKIMIEHARSTLQLCARLKLRPTQRLNIIHKHHPFLVFASNVSKLNHLLKDGKGEAMNNRYPLKRLQYILRYIVIERDIRD